MPNHAVYQLHSSRTARIGFCAATCLALGSAPVWAVSRDLAVVPLFDGQRSEFLNTWGGAWGPGSTQGIRLLPADAQSGRRVLCVELGKSRRPNIATCNVSLRGSALRGNTTRCAIWALRAASYRSAEQDACRAALCGASQGLSRFQGPKRDLSLRIARQRGCRRRSRLRWHWPMPIGPWKVIPT